MIIVTKAYNSDIECQALLAVTKCAAAECTVTSVQWTLATDSLLLLELFSKMSLVLKDEAFLETF